MVLRGVRIQIKFFKTYLKTTVIKATPTAKVKKQKGAKKNKNANNP